LRFDLLQWGRAFSSAEIGNKVLLLHCDDLLQWGRAFSSAEMQQVKTSHYRLFLGFNGAALFQARK